MNLLIFIMAAVFIVGIAFYLYILINRTMRLFKVKVKRIAKIIIMIVVLAVTALSMRFWGLATLTIVELLLISAVMELIYLILNIISKKTGLRIAKFKKVYESGMIPVILTIIVIIYGSINMKNVVEKDYSIYTNKNIRSEGYRVAMISDLHFGTTMDKAKLLKYCEEINETNPDIVVLCGDIVDEETDNEEMHEAFEALGEIKSTYGIFFVYGNHDKAKYSSNPNFTVDELENAIISNNINILVDESYEINDDLVLIGRDDRPYGNSRSRKSSEELISDLDKNKFLLVLDHQPCDLDVNSSLGYDLQLSGHTHSGQVWPAGQLSELLKINEMNYGYRKINDFQVIVSSGIAGWGYSIRTGSHSEYVIIDISKN